jgi:hypothetical protein
VPFTPEQKLRLMAAYAPVLYLHRSERFVPVSPTAYLQSAALWDDLAPGSHLRESWGHPTEGGGLGPPPAFPRAPLLHPGQLTVDPAAAGGNVHFLGEQAAFTQSDAERALFLDVRGWWEEGALPEFGNEAGKVQETTQNRWAFVDRLAASWGPWRPEDPAEPVPPEVAMLEPFRRRLSADVHDWVSLSWAISQLVGNPELVPMLTKIVSQTDNQNLWFIFYHFFYPAHEESLRWCEFVALLNNLNKALPVAATHGRNRLGPYRTSRPRLDHSDAPSSSARARRAWSPVPRSRISIPTRASLWARHRWRFAKFANLSARATSCSADSCSARAASSSSARSTTSGLVCARALRRSRQRACFWALVRTIRPYAVRLRNCCRAMGPTAAHRGGRHQTPDLCRKLVAKLLSDVVERLLSARLVIGQEGPVGSPALAWQAAYEAADDDARGWNPRPTCQACRPRTQT